VLRRQKGGTIVSLASLAGRNPVRCGPPTRRRMGADRPLALRAPGGPQGRDPRDHPRAGLDPHRVRPRPGQRWRRRTSWFGRRMWRRLLVAALQLPARATVSESKFVPPTPRPRKILRNSATEAAETQRRSARCLRVSVANYARMPSRADRARRSGEIAARIPIGQALVVEAEAVHGSWPAGRGRARDSRSRSSRARR